MFIFVVAITLIVLIYSYYSCKTSDIKPIRRCLRNFLRIDRYWGIFSFQPTTMTCIERCDVDVLKKYEPFGLVLYKFDKYIMIPHYIMYDYYDLYTKLLDPISKDLVRTDTEFMIDLSTFRRRLRV